MWNYTKCTAKDRIEKLNRLTDAFHEEADCLEYVPVNNYSFHVVCIGENGIKTQGRPCKNVEQAVRQFLANIS